MTLTVNQRSADIEAMAEEWATIDALMGGTVAMRKAGERLLPKWPNEEDESYKARLRTATLFPAYRRTVGVMAGKPFSRQLTLSSDTPAQLAQWSDDIDNEGVNLHSFASEMFLEAVGWGFGGILVEAPKKITPANGRAPTRAEQQAAGIRPYWVRVKHDQVLGWRTRKINGASVLTQLRIAEADTEDDGDFGEKEVLRVRVLEPGAYRVYQAPQGKSSNWTIVDHGSTGLDVITFVPIYGVRRRFMVGAPPLVDLAHLNVKHWQSQSDQDTILHVARVPILFAKMFGSDATITVGASTAVKAEHKDAELKYVEHTGEAIEAGSKSLQDLEQQMIQSGAELLVKKPGQRSATESAIDAEANKCDLQRIAEAFEDSLDLAMYYTARYASLDRGGKVTLFKDFGASTLTEASGQLVNDMQSRGLIRKVTAIKEQQRRGILSADIDPETEVALAEEEGPAPGSMGDDDAIGTMTSLGLRVSR